MDLKRLRRGICDANEILCSILKSYSANVVVHSVYILRFQSHKHMWQYIFCLYVSCNRSPDKLNDYRVRHDVQ